MLRRLSIENFAVIEHVELDFGPAFNVITGETGAGKSLLIEALMAVLGERTSTDVIHNKARRAVVEAEFDIVGNNELITILEQNGYLLQPHQLILRREVNPSGSRAFVNDSPAPLTYVRQLGDLLVDFHGQHEHQSLLKSSLHRKLLDDVGSLEHLLDEYYTAWVEYRSAIDHYCMIQERGREFRHQRDYKHFLLTELRTIDPLPDEKTQLETELRRIEHSEHLFEATTTCYNFLYADVHSVHDTLVRVRSIVEHLATIDQYFQSLSNELRELVIRCDEVANDIQRYNSQIEHSPERVQEIRERLVYLTRLERRYGSIEHAIAERHRLEEELAWVDNFEAELERLCEQITIHRRILGNCAQHLSLKRQQTAERIERSIKEILAKLGMPDASFRVAINHHTLTDPSITDTIADCDGVYYKAYEHGIDEITFLVSTNKGEPLAPLQRIVSGGEASRIMLALKSILATSDRLPLLVFDEIDTGISGHIAHRVGVALEELSNYHQVIAITHNPQIAARAQNHLVVEKYTDDQRAYVRVRQVSGSDRVEELAKLIAGEHITDGARRTAQDLLKHDPSYAQA